VNKPSSTEYPKWGRLQRNSQSIFGEIKNKCAVHPKKEGVHTITRGFV